jgi:hypothetical protein
MTSLFKETKIYFDTMFDTLWTATPIHYAGQEFDSKGISEWVNPVYIPASGYHVDLCSRTLNTGYLHCTCWADNQMSSLELSDELIGFIQTNTDANRYRITGFQINDNGWNGKKAFLLISFNIELLA